MSLYMVDYVAAEQISTNNVMLVALTACHWIHSEDIQRNSFSFHSLVRFNFQGIVHLSL